jgi:photosystem II stability/assembly factor-like uncharacterized protein
MGATGTWENITPADIVASADHSTLAFVLDPQDAGTVYLGSVRKGLYKTTDCGASWTHANTGTLGPMLDTGMMGTMVMDPKDPMTFYTDNRYGPGGLFRTKSGGVDWEQVFQPADILDTFIFGGTVEWVAMDPTDSTHLVVSPHFSCASPHSTNCMIEGKGSSWSVIENTPPMGELGGQVMLDPTTWLLMTQDTGIWRTADGGKTWQNVYMGSCLPSLYRGPDGAYYVPANNAGVVRSTDGINWMPIAGSPATGALVGSGDTLYVSTPFVAVGYATYTIGGSTQFTPLPKTPTQQGGWMLRYDPDHHVLYSSNFGDGFWRLVTQ